MDRLNLMKADNMYVIFHSKNHKNLKDKSPSLFQTEKWYSKAYSVEQLSNKTMTDLNNAKK
jgi:hypothetical protein